MKARPKHEKTKLIALIDSGMTTKDAAMRMNLPESTAQKWARQHFGLRRPDLAGIKAPSFSKWPETYRSACEHLPIYARQAFGRFMLENGEREITRDAVRQFTAKRKRLLAPVRAVGELRGLARCLAAIFPEEDWNFLKAKVPYLRTDGKSPENKKKRGGVRTLSVELDEWPAQHCQAWEALMARGSLKVSGRTRKRKSRRKDTSPETFKSIAGAYGRYLFFVRKEGLPDIVEPDILQDYIDACRDRGLRERTISTYVTSLSMMMPVLEPSTNFIWLKKTAASMDKIAREEPKIKWGKRRVDPTELWVLGQVFVKSARNSDPTLAATARVFRDGVILMMASSLALRLKNLANINIGSNLIMPESGPAILRYASHEMKNGDGVELIIWDELKDALQEYIERYRPVLMSSSYEGNALWHSLTTSNPLGASGIYVMITKVTEQYLGVRINPHLIRDCVAEKLIDAYPETPEYASKMLQHRNPKTLGEYTEMAGTISASRKLNDIIAQSH